MKKLLIATKNNDKYSIVSALIGKVLSGDVSFHSLKDAGIGYDINEEGSILERSEQKAKVYWDYLDKERKSLYLAVIGIDDGFSIDREKEGDPNSKELTDKILAGGLVNPGDTIWIKRGFAIYNDNGLVSCLTSIPFVFLGNPENISREEGIYPLSSVLASVDGNVSIKDMNFDDTIRYYLEYCGQDLKKIFKGI